MNEAELQRGRAGSQLYDSAARRDGDGVCTIAGAHLLHDADRRGDAKHRETIALNRR